ncbi:hypothetical protein LSAT2_015311 [Lamellibrachia satsuma]|nr:hypothetical protein LSAT2_015311 [Lamellibrachia satsuma]
MRCVGACTRNGTVGSRGSPILNRRLPDDVAFAADSVRSAVDADEFSSSFARRLSPNYWITVAVGGCRSVFANGKAELLTCAAPHTSDTLTLAPHTGDTLTLVPRTDDTDVDVATGNSLTIADR